MEHSVPCFYFDITLLTHKTSAHHYYCQYDRRLLSNESSLIYKYFSFSASLNSIRLILPELVLGKSSTNSIALGYL